MALHNYGIWHCMLYLIYKTRVRNFIEANICVWTSWWGIRQLGRDGPWNGGCIDERKINRFIQKIK
jgi:hypothetical protein